MTRPQGRSSGRFAPNLAATPPASIKTAPPTAWRYEHASAPLTLSLGCCTH